MQKPGYAAAVAHFDMQTAAEVLSGSLVERLNACVECCDRHAQPGRIALAFEGRGGFSETYTFAQLRDLSARFANFLTSQGVRAGDRVAGLLPRTPELLITILGVWRAGAVYQPLFTAFGPKAIEHRVQTARTRLIVTDAANRAKLDDVAGGPPVVSIGTPGEGVRPGDFDFWSELKAQPPTYTPVLRTGDDPFMMMFTSGTTGPSKPVAVPLKALVAFIGYIREAVDLRPEDAFWNIADPGWAYGLYYAVAAPLAMGHATTFYDGAFSAESTYRIIHKYGITNLAGSPTAYRMLMAAGPDAAAGIKGQIRVLSSAGEPLNPEVIRWFAEHVGAPLHDHYGQTELGMVVCNHHGLQHPVRLGAAGFASPGYRIVVLDGDNRELPAGQPGILAVDRAHSPLDWFSGYWEQPTAAIGSGYYRSGDTVELNDDGSISFVGRSDDIITSAGYRIGPFEVESALIEHPAVVEAAAIGKPDPERTEIVKAFVVLAQGHAATPSLAEALQQHVRQRLSAHAFPREVEFVDALPKTPSGKVQRFILRNQEIAKAAAGA